MKSTSIWTAVAVMLLFVAVVSSVCPPSVHLPAIIAFFVSFLIALIKALTAMRER